MEIFFIHRVEVFLNMPLRSTSGESLPSHALARLPYLEYEAYVDIVEDSTLFSTPPGSEEGQQNANLILIQRDDLGIVAVMEHQFATFVMFNHPLPVSAPNTPPETPPATPSIISPTDAPEQANVIPNVHP